MINSSWDFYESKTYQLNIIHLTNYRYVMLQTHKRTRLGLLIGSRNQLKKSSKKGILLLIYLLHIFEKDQL